MNHVATVRSRATAKNAQTTLRGSIRSTVAMGCVLTLAAAGVAHGADLYWSNSGSTANDWGDAANWSTDVDGNVPSADIPGGSDLAFFNASSVSSNQTVYTNGDQAVLGLDFTTSNNTTIRSATSSINSILSIGASGITNTSAGTGAVTIAGDNVNRKLSIALTADQTWQNDRPDATGSLQFGSASTSVTGELLTSAGGARNLTLSGTGTSASNRINNDITNGTGTLSIVKDGTGTWHIFSTRNASRYSGGTTVKDGLLIATANGTGLSRENVLGNGNITLEGGTISFRATGTVNTTPQTIAFNSNVVVAGDATIDVVRTGSTAQNKTIAQDKLTIGANTLTVTGGAGYDLRFNGITTLTGNATFNPTTAKLTLAQAIGDGGSGFSLTKTGSNTLTLTAANTYTGPTNVSAGTLVINGNQSAATGLVSVSTGATLAGTGTTGGDVTFDSGSGILFGQTGLTVDGTIGFGGSFGIADIVGLSSASADGSYQLLSGTITTANLLNIGAENAFDLGDGKEAYFTTGSGLGVSVVPEPVAGVAIATGLAAAACWWRARRPRSA